MSKITNDGLIRAGRGCFDVLYTHYPYSNSGRQRLNVPSCPASHHIRNSL